VDKDGKAQTRPVEVGDWQGDNWFIYKGLSAGDRVITDGLVRVATGRPVKIVASGAGGNANVPPDHAPAGQN
jgi:membrane fusion protein (multidrug efflux system)